MWSLLNHPSNVVFGIALGFMLLLGVIELVSLMMGGLTDWLDGFLPDSLSGDLHTDFHVDTDGSGVILLHEQKCGLPCGGISSCHTICPATIKIAFIIKLLVNLSSPSHTLSINDIH